MAWLGAVATDLLGWLIGSAWGRRVALLALGAAVLVLVLLRVRAGGYDARDAEEQVARLQGAMERIKIDDSVRSMAPRARADALRRWVRQPPGPVLR